MHVKNNFPNQTTLGSHHDYFTRNKDKLAIVPHNLTFLEKKPSYAGVKYYNHLPCIIKSIADVDIFKKELKKFLMLKPLYSLNEFFEASN